MRCASWNVNSLRVRLPQVLDWLASAQPDLIGLQETKIQDEDFPLLDIEAAGYEAVYSGQKTYNGVAILSRLPFSATDIDTDIPGLDDPQRRVLAATYGEIRFINLYVPNGAVVGSEKYTYKLEWLKRLNAYLQQQLILCGGKVGQLAKRVGMERPHLYRKLRALGVDFRQVTADE